MFIIFDTNNNMVFAGTVIPVSHTGPEYTKARLPEDEVFDGSYSYRIVNGEAVRDKLLPRNLEEEAEMQAAYDAQAYARSRKAKYDLLNQDELRYDDRSRNR